MKYTRSKLGYFCFYCASLIIAFCALGADSYAQSISSTELINNAEDYDAETVVFEGEVIGDIMARGQFVWINVNDANAAIGVWASKDLARDISCAGSYKCRGDRIRVTGVFHRGCPQHGGDLDIHAQSILKIRSGAGTPEKVSAKKRNFAIILLVVLCAFAIAGRIKLK